MEPKHYRYFILGDPALLTSKHYGTGRMFDSYQNLKARWRDELVEQHQPCSIITKPIDLDIHFYFHRIQPKKQHSLKHPVRGDIPAMIKFVADMSTSIIFKDQALIINTICHKQFVDENARTEFIIREICNE